MDNLLGFHSQYLDGAKAGRRRVAETNLIPQTASNYLIFLK